MYNTMQRGGEYCGLWNGVARKAGLQREERGRVLLQILAQIQLTNIIGHADQF